MGMSGHFQRITPQQLAECQAEPERVLDILYPPFASTDERLHLDIDKSWHAIHFLLTGSADERVPPLGNAVLGGNELGDVDLGMGPGRYLTAAEVRHITAALGQIPATTLREHFSLSALAAANIYPNVWRRGDAETEWAYILPYYTALVAFYHAAAQAGDAMLLYIN